MDSHEYQIYDTLHLSQQIGKSLLMEKCTLEWHRGCANSRTEEHQAIPAISYRGGNIKIGSTVVMSMGILNF